MTIEEYDRLSYILGRIEGIASGIENRNIETALMDTAEMISEMLEVSKVEPFKGEGVSDV